MIASNKKRLNITLAHDVIEQMDELKKIDGCHSYSELIRSLIVKYYRETQLITRK